MRLLTIKRSEWYRGKGSNFSRLVTDCGQKCCLGFEALACGVPYEELVYKPSPKCISDKFSDKINHLLDSNFKRNSEFTFAAIAINDNPTLSEAERERLLIELFASQDIRVEFVP